MILCSKRVYLNVLTQLWTKDLLLNANYFILDQPNVGLKVPSTRRIGYDEDNNVKTYYDSNMSKRALAGFSQYYVNYIDGNLLDPSVFVTTLVSQTGKDDEVSVYESVINELNKDSTKEAVLDGLFKKPLKGNGIQICIYLGDSTVVQFGNLICQYLSKNFGCDIVFLDALCRKDVYGQGFYPGDKVAGENTTRYIRDYKLIKKFKENLATSVTATTQNINVFLLHKQWDELYYLYQLLFPDIPLPPGQYTEQMLRDIIVGLATDGRPPDTYDTRTQHDVNSLIWSTTDVFGSLLEQYEDPAEMSEYGNMDIAALFE